MTEILKRYQSLRMVLVDTNSLVLVVLGLMDVNLIGRHKTTSIYEEEDFNNIMHIINYDLKNILAIPNTLTELDNLLNNFGGIYANTYQTVIRKILKETTEKIFESASVVDSPYLPILGLTDSIILEIANHYEALITSDSKLSDYAFARGIVVFDMVKERNARI